MSCVTTDKNNCWNEGTIKKRQWKRQGVHQGATQWQQPSHIRYHGICLQVELVQEMLQTLDSRAIFSQQGSEERTYKQSIALELRRLLGVHP